MALSTMVFADPYFTEIDRAVNRFLHSALGTNSPNVQAGCTPRAGSHPSLAMDIIETPTSYELHADTPGMSPDDLKLELHEGLLTLSGERKISHTVKDEGGKVWRNERGSYSFRRAFTLPENANAEAISASIDKGVLKVTVSKKDPPAKPEPKRIAVKSVL